MNLMIFYIVACTLFSLLFLYSLNVYSIDAQEYESCSISDIEGYSLENETSMEQASVCWYQWLYSIPVNNSPLLDTTGVNCNVGQSGPIFFLVGSGDGSSTSRECVISQDKDIFSPVLNSECNNVEFTELKLPEEFKKCAKEFQDEATAFKATLDGVELPIVRVVTDVFEFSLPENNIFNTGESTNAISAGNGHYIYITDLEPGEYTLKFSAVNIQELNSMADNPFMQDNTYKLIIE